MQKQLYDKISEAKTKYGEEVYNLTLGQLRQEFGEDAFPVWISRFSDLDQSLPDLGPASWRPLDDIPYDHEQLELWTITESFCYKYTPLGYSKALNTTQRNYFIAFSDALRYEISLLIFVP